MYNKSIIIIIIVGLMTASFVCQAYSQAPPDASSIERATRESDRQIREEVEEKLRVPPKEPPKIEEEEEVEEVVEGPKFFIKRIDLIGVESFSPDEFKPVIESYENREVTLQELEILAKKIEREYLKRGIIAACFVPPQDITEEGIAVLRVVEARMGDLEIEDHKYFDEDRISYYWEPKKGEILRYDEISRSLQFINKNPDRRAKAALRAGTKPRTTDVSLKVDTHYPLHTTFSLDREGNSTSGWWRKGTGFRHNNFLGFDDTLISGYLWGNHFWGVYSYHTVPITSFGTTLLYGFNYNKTKSKGDYHLFDIDTRSKNFSFFVHQDLYQKDLYIGDLHLGLDAKDRTIKMTTGVINRDRLRILRAGGNFVHRDMDTATYIKPEISQGINFLGARRTDRLTTRRAKNYFTKLTTEIQHRKALPLDLQLSFNIKTQLALTRLVSFEQFSMGGLKSVRGYPVSEYLADNVIQTNVELLFPAFFIPDYVKIPYAPRALKEDVTGVVFFDYGYGGRRGRNMLTEKKVVKLASIGAGLRIRLFNQALLRLEWGFPIGDKPITGSDFGRLHFSLDFEDRILDVLEGVDKELKKRKLEQDKAKTKTL